MKILIKDDQDIAKAHQVYTNFTHDEQMRAAYESRQKWLHDYNSAIAAAEEKGMKKGREEEKTGLALKMIEIGLPLEQIATLTGCSLEKLKQMEKHK